MKKLLTVASLGVALVLTSLTPASAITRSDILAAGKVSAVEQVQMRRDRAKWRGYHGYRDRRPGFRRHSNGFWYPLAAFGAGAIIGGAIVRDRSPRMYRGHVAWCMERYRSYRVSDNTYKPNYGPRRQCVSP